MSLADMREKTSSAVSGRDQNCHVREGRRGQAYLDPVDF